MRSLALVSAMMAVATASAGCAVIAAKAPDPERPSGTPPMCNDGKGGVAVDGLMATALGVATLALAPGAQVWAIVKAVSFDRANTPGRTPLPDLRPPAPRSDPAQTSAPPAPGMESPR